MNPTIRVHLTSFRSLGHAGTSALQPMFSSRLPDALAFASRPRDWLDVESVVARQVQLDHAYILRQLTILCELKEAPEIVERTRKLLETGGA